VAVGRGGGRDRPEAACPPGSRAAVGGAGGFNAVQKLLTTTSAIRSCTERVTGIDHTVGLGTNLIRRIHCGRPDDRARHGRRQWPRLAVSCRLLGHIKGTEQSGQGHPRGGHVGGVLWRYGCKPTQHANSGSCISPAA
jgi:hypothetical protein